jgi:hypothetical protein
MPMSADTVATRISTRVESCATSAGLTANANGMMYFTAPSRIAVIEVDIAGVPAMFAAANEARATGGVM